MKWITYAVFTNLFYVPVWLLTIARMGRPEDGRTIKECYNHIVRVTRRIVKKGGVTVMATGIKHTPSQDGLMFFPNHQGLSDMLALLSTCPRPFSAVTKRKASGWILVKQVIDTTRSPTMDRGDIKDQVGIIGEVTKRVREGSNFVIFAEGHRNHRGNETLDFKSGTFKSTLRTGCPIVPVVLINSFRPFDVNSLSREYAEVYCMEPILPEQYIGARTSEIAHLVHNRAQEEINKNVGKSTLTT